MQWTHDLAYFFGGLFLTNALPHWISGVTGHPFQSPFSKPPGQGLSSSTVNILWGFFNLVIGYLLVFQVGNFDPQSPEHIIAIGTGILVMGLLSARLFGRFHGGDLK